jgi:hypothetical protein
MPSLLTANDPENVECVKFCSYSHGATKLWNRQLWQTVHVLTPDLAALNFE